MTSLTRRQFLGAAAGLVVAGNALALPARALQINPRSSWATGLEPKGPLNGEDVKFLIVHHSASHNGRSGAETPAILRSWFEYHTGPKGWNDIAYNFVIDADGGVWEARKGSLDGPIAGDATGGNQGFTQLVCLVGDFNTAQPTSAAKSSLVVLLAWLAERYGLSTAPGAEATFTSRGSNRWPSGTAVTTPTICGHRDMSNTTCPGDNLYPYVAGPLIADVEAARGGSPSVAVPATTPTSSTTSTSTTTTTSTTSTTPTASTTSTTTIPPSTTTTPAVSTSVPRTSTTVVPTTVPRTPVATVAIAGGDLAAGPARTGLLTTAGALVVTGAGLALWRYRRMGGPNEGSGRHKRDGPRL
ncbi:MAG: peptidoglycan recognition family protein [Acidimicrobiia bacterium]